jgi:hypothetical protein
MARDGAYFTGDRGFWDDPDFETIEEQVVYSMLWQAHGTDIAGVRVRNDNLDCVRTHLTLSTYRDTLSILYTKGKVRLYPNRIWVKAAIWYNLGKGNYSEKQMQAVVSRLKSCGSIEMVKDIVDYYGDKYGMDIPYTYPIPTLPIGCPSDTVTDTVPHTVTDTHTSNDDISAFAEAKRQNLKERREAVYPQIFTYFNHFDWAPDDERKQYELAGWLINKCGPENPELAPELLHARCESLRGLKSLDAFYKYMNGKNSPTKDPATMGELQSEANKRL